METKEEILEELNAFLDAAEKARREFYAKAVRLASCVAAECNGMGEFADEIRAFVKADERYGKAVVDATCAHARLSRFLETDHKGGER